MHRIGISTILLIAFALPLASCGSSGGTEFGGVGPLTVAAASSLTEPFEAYAEELPGEQRFSFAGSDALAAQIRQGVRPDVYASANTRYPQELAAEGLVEDPVVFTQNRLVIAVAVDSPIDSLDDLLEPGVDLVVCAAGVPCGDYTVELLERLPKAERAALLANVRSEEPDVKGVIGKVIQGAAEAGFVYASDAVAAGSEVRAVEIPPALEPAVAYAIAVVDGSDDPKGAERFIAGLLDGPGAEALAAAGFLPPP